MPNLAASLSNLAASQIENGQREAALKTAWEAVKIRRKLTEGNRAAFLPNLAMSLGVLSKAHSALNEHQQAQNCLIEAITLFLPMVETHPRHHARLFLLLEEAYLAACQATDTSPDQSLLARIAAIKESLQ
ncbi:MAG: tetratricopeptide repeat protein [Acidobacteria bacterium]|nr:tetratricopeptide repeat protein [Acidobacteriota bacterium]